MLLVPATAQTPTGQYGWNYMRFFAAQDRPYCGVATPKNAMGDLQISAEYVVHAIRAMHAASGRRIVLMGGSQGGVLPRWALRFWPDTRAMVAEHIGLAPANHGGDNVRPLLCTPDCSPGLWQQITGSKWMTALNSGQETFPGIDYTEIYTRYDVVVNPNTDDTGSSSLHGGGGRITNVALQDVCPGNAADHLQAASWDPVAHALAMDAPTHDGPADPARVDRAVCAKPFPPGLDPVASAADLAGVVADLAWRVATAERVAAEPPLRCYVTESC